MSEVLTVRWFRVAVSEVLTVPWFRVPVSEVLTVIWFASCRVRNVDCTLV